MTQLYSNSARAVLSALIDNVATSLIVSSAANFPVITLPGEYFYATIYIGDVGAETALEIVKVTATTGTVFTIVRAQESTAAVNFITHGGTARLDLRLTAAGATEWLQKSDNLSGLTVLADARSNLGLGTAATTAATDYATAAHNHTGTYEPADATILKDADIGVNVSAQGHNHSGTYEPADATILKDADIGVTVQAYDADLTSWAALAPSAKQDALVSGTNIKTINSNSLLGSGNIDVSGGITFQRKTANYTAAAKEGIIADTSGGTFTITLPATPSTGDQVIVADGADWGATNLTVGRNGSTIEGAAENLVLDVSGAEVTLTYDGTTWHVYTQVGATSGAASGGVSNIVTATTATTLTNTGTLLQITPAGYGVAVTLPDATTCPEGGPLHIIDNKGAYPVRVLNSAGTLIGFIYGGVVSHVSLIDNSTAAGVWSVENSELVGASAQLLTTFATISSVSVSGAFQLDSDREVLVGYQATTGYVMAVVYNKTTNAFGSATVVRPVNIGSSGLIAALKSATDQVLVVSCGTTNFESVTLSISGTTITVNTAATATLSNNISIFADGCGLIAIPGASGSFVTSYTVATPAAQIRAISVSGTTVTIGSAEVLDGTAGGLIAASSDKVIAVSATTTNIYTKPYTVSGSTLSAGTGTATAGGTMTLNKFAPLGPRWFVSYLNGGSNQVGAVVSLSGTTTTISTANLFANVTLADAIVVGSNKVLVLSTTASTNANILTDTAGTASAGTAITLTSGASRFCVYADGTSVVVYDQTTAYYLLTVDCSGASPVLARTIKTTANSTAAPFITASNSVLSRSANALYGTSFAQVSRDLGNHALMWRAWKGEVSVVPTKAFGLGTTNYRGINASEIWVTDAATVITKVELAVGALS